jgi:hypothetical protein
MAGNVDAMSERDKWQERAAPGTCARASHKREFASSRRAAVAGRPMWSRAVHDRNARGKARALGNGAGGRWCGRSNWAAPPDGAALALRFTAAPRVTGRRSATRDTRDTVRRCSYSRGSQRTRRSGEGENS